MKRQKIRSFIYKLPFRMQKEENKTYKQNPGQK